MKAAKESREAEGDRSGIYGHIPGVAVSDVFEGRGELAVLGLHTQMMKGINCRCGSNVEQAGPAEHLTSICASACAEQEHSPV
jgi:hypothetical protein